MSKKIPAAQGNTALCKYIWTIAPQKLSEFSQKADSGDSICPQNTLATAVRWTLQKLEERAPGRAVEVRVPPYGAVQVMEGTTHRRGTPPAVIEMSADTWLRLASGLLTWGDALGASQISASGERADLSTLLPLFPPEHFELRE